MLLRLVRCDKLFLFWLGFSGSAERASANAPSDFEIVSIHYLFSLALALLYMHLTIGKLSGVI